MTFRALAAMHARTTRGDWHVLREPWSKDSGRGRIICQEDGCSLGTMEAGFPQCPMDEQESNAAYTVAMHNAAPAIFRALEAAMAVVATRAEWLKDQSFDYGPEIERKIDAMASALAELDGGGGRV